MYSQLKLPTLQAVDAFFVLNSLLASSDRLLLPEGWQECATVAIETFRVKTEPKAQVESDGRSRLPDCVLLFPLPITGTCGKTLFSRPARPQIPPKIQTLAAMRAPNEDASKAGHDDDSESQGYEGAPAHLGPCSGSGYAGLSAARLLAMRSDVSLIHLCYSPERLTSFKDAQTRTQLFMELEQDQLCATAMVRLHNVLKGLRCHGPQAHPQRNTPRHPKCCNTQMVPWRLCCPGQAVTQQD